MIDEVVEEEEENCMIKRSVMILTLTTICLSTTRVVDATNDTTTTTESPIFTTTADNSTTEEPNVDILDDISNWKWAQMGVCGFCSSSMDCCDAIAFGVENGTIPSWKYYDRELSCNGTRFSEEELLDEHGERRGTTTTMQERYDRVSWCDQYCTVCYADPKTSVVSYCQASLQKDDEVAWMIVLSFGSSLFLMICFYILQIVGRRDERIRNLTVLPMMDSYLQYFSIMYSALILLYVLTDPASAKTLSERVCCSQNTSLRAMILLVFIATEQVAPLFILLQKSFTRRAFRESFKEALLIAFPYPVLIFCWLTVPLNPLEVDVDNATFSLNFIYSMGYAYIVVFLLYLVGRMFFARQLIRAKPYILVYAIPYCVFLAVWSGLQLSDKTWLAAIALLISWNLLRMPLIYYCLRRETAFWRRDDDMGRLAALSGAVISDLQMFMDRNRHLLLDYLDIEFGEMIGKGTTAEVFAARYKKGDVAAKRYTPSNITASLLDEFAEEAELMLPFKHRNVASIIGLSVMPPHVVLIMPIFRNGSLKELLKCQLKLAEVERRAPGDASKEEMDDDSDDGGDLVSFPTDQFMSGFVKMVSGVFASRSESGSPGDDVELHSVPSVRTSSSDPPVHLRGDSAPSLVIDVGDAKFDTPADTNTGQEVRPTRDEYFGNILSWDRRMAMAVQVVDAIKYIHAQTPSIIHRDVKPANIMLDDDFTIKLGDFGESTVSFESSSTRRRRKTRKGSQWRISQGKSSKRMRHKIGFEKSESWNDMFQKYGFNCLQGCGRHAGWMSMTCVCMGVFFPLIFVSVLVARSVAFAGFGALIISAIGFVLLTDFYFHNMPRCENVCCKEKSKEDENEIVRSIRGSPSWMAPEVLSGKYGMAHYGPAVDVYSATVVVWQLLSLEALYPKMSRFDIEDYVKDGNRPEVPIEWPANVTRIITAGWHQNPNLRCSASELHVRLHRLLPNRRRSPSHSLRAPGRTFSVTRSRSMPSQGVYRRNSTPAGAKAKRKLDMAAKDNYSTRSLESLIPMKEKPDMMVPPILKTSKTDPIESDSILLHDLAPHTPSPSSRTPVSRDSDSAVIEVKLPHQHDCLSNNSIGINDENEKESEKIIPEGKIAEKKIPGSIEVENESDKVVLESKIAKMEKPPLSKGTPSGFSDDGFEKTNGRKGPGPSAKLDEGGDDAVFPDAQKDAFADDGGV